MMYAQQQRPNDRPFSLLSRRRDRTLLHNHFGIRDNQHDSSFSE